MDSGDVAGDVFHSNRILDRKPMALALDPRLVDQDATISSEA